MFGHPGLWPWPGQLSLDPGSAAPGPPSTPKSAPRPSSPSPRPPSHAQRGNGGPNSALGAHTRPGPGHPGAACWNLDRRGPPAPAQTGERAPRPRTSPVRATAAGRTAGPRGRGKVVGTAAPPRRSLPGTAARAPLCRPRRPPESRPRAGPAPRGHPTEEPPAGLASGPRGKPVRVGAELGATFISLPLPGRGGVPPRSPTTCAASGALGEVGWGTRSRAGMSFAQL